MLLYGLKDIDGKEYVLCTERLRDSLHEAREFVNYVEPLEPKPKELPKTVEELKHLFYEWKYVSCGLKISVDEFLKDQGYETE